MAVSPVTAGPIKPVEGTRTIEFPSGAARDGGPAEEHTLDRFRPA
jgi:hypothetical protein